MHPESPSSPSSAPPSNWATGWSPSPRAIRGRAELFAEKYGVERVLASYADVIADPEVDVVYNPLANSLHAPWNLAAIAAGKPVLTEKPFARNRAEAAAGRRGRRGRGRHGDGGLPLLFHPVTRRALELAGDGTIGEITTSRCGWRCPRRSAADPRWSLEMAGGALMDLGCYGLHIMRRLGHPSVVRAHAKRAQSGCRRMVRRGARLSPAAQPA